MTAHPAPIALTQHGWRGMRYVLSEKTLADQVFYAENMMPADPVGAGPYVRRPDDQLLAIGTASTMQHLGVYDQTAGAIPVAVASGEIYTLSGSSWGRLVTAANLTTAGVTLSTTARVYGTTFGGLYIFNDGVHPPFSWDGTAGAAGLAVLTNAPARCYGRPTVYYAKLFFIKADGSGNPTNVIDWSEENQPNTGYEAGGFSNTWTLTQTGQGAIYCLVGSNEALYYFRAAATGAIRGAVNSTFTTSGVHDDVSTTIGTTSPEGALLIDHVIYHVDARGRPWRTPIGSAPEPIWRGIDAACGDGPTDAIDGRTAVNPTAAFVTAIPRYRAVLFGPYPSGFDQTRAWVYTHDTGLPASVWAFDPGSSGIALVTGVGISTGTYTGTHLGVTVGGVAKTISCPPVSGGSIWTDANTYVCRWGPFGPSSGQVQQFTELEMVYLLGASSATTGGTPTVQLTAAGKIGTSATAVALASAGSLPDAHNGPPQTVRLVYGLTQQQRFSFVTLQVARFAGVAAAWGVESLTMRTVPTPAPPQAKT